MRVGAGAVVPRNHSGLEGVALGVELRSTLPSFQAVLAHDGALGRMLQMSVIEREGGTFSYFGLENTVASPSDRGVSVYVVRFKYFVVK